MAGQRVNEDVVLPRVNVSIPATVYVNGRQVPPIESDGVITKFGCRSLRVTCDRRVPIPSNGVLRFSFESTDKGTLELNVEIVGCIQQQPNFWSWRKEPRYEVQLTLSMNNEDVSDRYLKFINQLIFGNKPARVEIVREKENGS